MEEGSGPQTYQAKGAESSKGKAIEEEPPVNSAQMKLSKACVAVGEDY